MEFGEKMQLLRKERGLTQAELAEQLFVSRAAVFKWESGRGYPGIDSLKAIAKYFSVSLDSLLSCDTVLAIAEEDGRQAQSRTCSLVFGLLDISGVLLLFLPVFGERTEDAVRSVSLLVLQGTSLYAGRLFCADRRLTALGNIASDPAKQCLLFLAAMEGQGVSCLECRRDAAVYGRPPALCRRSYSGFSADQDAFAAETLLIRFVSLS